MCNFPFSHIHKISIHQNFPFKSADCVCSLWNPHSRHYTLCLLVDKHVQQVDHIFFLKKNIFLLGSNDPKQPQSVKITVAVYLY